MKPSEYTVTGQLVGIAYEKWHSTLGNNGHRLFWEFVCPDQDYEQVQFYNFTPDEMNRLKLLTEPYYIAIIKTWLAKQERSNEKHSI